MSDPTPFETLFGRSPEVEGSAPGGVNLIGDHTDYNEGFVLPIAIPQRTTVQLATRPDRDVRAWSANVDGAEQQLAFGLGMERPRAAWVDYVQGVTATLAAEGVELGGFDLRVESTVPFGVGLSSSASLEVAVLRALVERFALSLDPVEIARLAHRAETGFVGVPVGMMDQMAASLASTNAAIFIDMRSLAYESVPMPTAVELLVVDSGVTQEHAGGECRIRRAECESAARALDVSSLRDANATLLAGRPLAPPLDRRARHVVSENERVLEMRQALRGDNVPAAGALMYASHRSLRDDFEVSTPEADLLVAIAQETDSVAGARLTGTDSGRCIVGLVAKGHAGTAGVAVTREYEQRSERRARVLVPTV